MGLAPAVHAPECPPAEGSGCQSSHALVHQGPRSQSLRRFDQELAAVMKIISLSFGPTDAGHADMLPGPEGSSVRKMHR